MAFLELADLKIEYEKHLPILKDFNLSVDKGEFLSLLGPSGCGKTTTLRTIAGFIEPSKGRVLIGGRDYTRMPPHKRNIGLVFQSYALFPHLSVFENVAFGLKMRGVKRDAIKSKVTAALATVDLAGLESRLPSQLSGGQRQRVALARAIVIEPDVLLLDEPLSNLDAKLRVGMRAELHRLQRQLGITAIYVTHDQVEALSLSDRIVVMNKGRIEQMGKPEEIYYRPATPFVAQFMGFDNHFTARVKSASDHQIQVEAGRVCLVAQTYANLNVRAGDQVEVLFRPETASLQKGPGANTFPGEIVFRNFQGSVAQYLIRTDVGEFTVAVSETLRSFDEGAIHVAILPTDLIVARYHGE
ncbi:MAG TPA: ABC transporter ATP-binding protein [Anaerolineae bacterium]